MAALKATTTSPCSLTSSPQCIFQLPPSSNAAFCLCLLSVHEGKGWAGGTMAQFEVKWWLDLSGQDPTEERNQHMEAGAHSAQHCLRPPPALGEEPGASRDGCCWCPVPCQDRLVPAPQCKVPSPFSGSLMLSVSLLSLSDELTK